MCRHDVRKMEVTSVGHAITECDAVLKGAISLFSLRQQSCQKINVLLHISE